jgi:hypothetical protein
MPASAPVGDDSLDKEVRMRLPARVRGHAEWIGVLVGAVVLVVGFLIGYTLAFARPLPAGAWVGLGVVVAVAVLLSSVAVAIVTRSDRAVTEPAERRVEPARPARRILVVADETIGSEELRRDVCDRVAGCESEVLVVVPALNTPIRHWTNEEDRAREEAAERLEEELRVLAGLGVPARGEIGADDPLQAVDDALRRFPADEIIISTHARGGENWREEGVVGRIREAYALPVTHVLVG